LAWTKVRCVVSQTALQRLAANKLAASPSTREVAGKRV